jgi:hypothetical protein
MRGARLARLVWRDPAFAETLERQAADLKHRFNHDFWLRTASTSRSRWMPVVQQLMSERLFSG